MGMGRVTVVVYFFFVFFESHQPQHLLCIYNSFALLLRLCHLPGKCGLPLYAQPMLCIEGCVKAASGEIEKWIVRNRGMGGALYA